MTDPDDALAEQQWREASFGDEGRQQLPQQTGDAVFQVTNDDTHTVKLVPDAVPLGGDPEGKIVRTDTTVSLEAWR